VTLESCCSRVEYAAQKKLTRRGRFLAQIKAATPWAQLVAVIEPHYPKGSRGRPPITLYRTLERSEEVSHAEARRRGAFAEDALTEADALAAVQDELF